MFHYITDKVLYNHAYLIMLFCVGFYACGGESEENRLDQMLSTVSDMNIEIQEGGTQNDDNDVTLALKSFAETCQRDQECQSGVCLDDGQSMTCTQVCNGDRCPLGWSCQESVATGDSGQLVCVPRKSRICQPCVTNNDCPNGSCIQLDQTLVCGTDCTNNDDCPNGYFCQSLDSTGLMQCIPRSNSCSCDQTTHGTERICQRNNQYGTCYGRETCDVTTGWGSCDAVEAQVETCNQIDDNCNGIVDDVEFLGEICSREVTIADRTEQCVGLLVCREGEANAVCSADYPEEELCNLRDDDCDGKTDENFEELDELCSVGQGACTRYGVFECNEESTGVQCSVIPGESNDEICDGLDNDCDGQSDEGFADLNQVCQVGIGVCLRSGVLRCAEDGLGVICSANVGEAEVEICDGLDNDCDGSIDNGFEEVGTLCTVGEGYCQRSAFYQCTEDGLGVTCPISPAIQQDHELCDGLDNDCDQKIDEDFALLNQFCQVGTGACERAGVFICAENANGISCSVEAGEPVDEICDGVDNDCDGQNDEQWPQVGLLCTKGQGVCQSIGHYQCAEDGLGDAQCNAEDIQANTQEFCDARDNDCDGTVDEGFIGENGVYDQVQACGSCALNCLAQWQGDPSNIHVIPRCVTDLQNAHCDYECMDGYVDRDGQAYNGCEFEQDTQAIYVVTSDEGGNDQALCGSLNQPCASIQFALQRAYDDNLPRVNVAEGSYQEIVELKEGIDLVGGYQAHTWLHDADRFHTVIDTRSLQHTQHAYALKANAINVATHVSHLYIYAGDAVTGHNSYAVYIQDSSQALWLEHLYVFAGQGGSGNIGNDGSHGEVGLDGQHGLGGTYIAQATNCGGDPYAGFTGVPGARARSQSCGGISTAGGHGAYSTCGFLFTQEAQRGDNGVGVLGGGGGLGATHFQSNQAQVCQTHEVNQNPPARLYAQKGSQGVDGSHGSLGSAHANTEGRVQGSHWSAYAGANGQAGVAGGGGGGGGAAAGVQLNWQTGSYDLGSSGGSGGNGGCSGTGGTGGFGGGGSFAIAIVYLGFIPNQESDLPRLTQNVIQRGFAGHGGRGGHGGLGGLGGQGGLGGESNQQNIQTPICAFPAGQGGRGGRGGHGGAGAGGNGGNSFDIFLGRNQNILPAHYVNENNFTFAEDINTHGNGGVAGHSLYDHSTDHTHGHDGQSGHILQLSF